MANVIIAKSARIMLENLEAYKVRSVGERRAQEIIDNLIESSVSSISENPGMHHKNLDALSRGVTLYEWIDTVNQYKALYTFDGKQAAIVIYCSTKEDFMRLFYLIMMSH